MPKGGFIVMESMTATILGGIRQGAHVHKIVIFAGRRMPAGRYRVNRERERASANLCLILGSAQILYHACSSVQGRIKVNDMLSVEL